MLKRAARLLFPALRWHAESGFGHETAAIDDALRIGVGGFIIFGGNAHAVRELTESLHSRSPHPLLIAGDFNAVPWSQTLRQFQAYTRTERVSGLGPSWLHRFFPTSVARWVGLPLDHIVASQDIILRGAEMLVPIGSDHLPIRMRFSLKKKPADPEEEQQVQTVMLP